MKKICCLFLSICFFAQVGFAGGIVTNTNQSAAWVRTLVRDASINIDAVYFNPAGVARLADGFYVEVNNQTISQTRTITNNYPLLKNAKYEAAVSAPFFPSAFVAFKKGNFAVHAGFGVVGGGGSAEYKTGLPSFEMGISDLKVKLASAGVTDYSSQIYFKGSSTYIGIQLGATYKINEFIAVGYGARYIMATNTYSGYIKSIQINPGGGPLMRADAFFTGRATALKPAVDGTNYLVTAGAGAYTFAQLQGAGQITATQRAQLEGGLLALGYPQAAIDAMNMNTAYATYNGAYNQMLGGAAQTADKEVDVTQEGTSITPIVSVDLSMLDGKLGIALKYEHKTPLELTNATVVDGSGMFPDKVVVPSEMPALLSVGVRYSISDKFRTQVGVHYYMDRAAKYGKMDPVTKAYVTNGTEVTFSDGTKGAYLDGDSYEAGISFEYDVVKMLSVSAGYIYASQSPSNYYQTDMSYSLNTNTIGFGAALHLIDRLEVNLGFLNTWYTGADKTFKSGTINVIESYKKTTYLFAIGLGYRFGK
ncbi:MAG: hypothetical protein NTV01_07300 [Bacteroidia bacterium]|nr:hypothetical protein [Bacteroidia bacterium]